MGSSIQAYQELRRNGRNNNGHRSTAGTIAVPVARTLCTSQDRSTRISRNQYNDRYAVNVVPCIPSQPHISAGETSTCKVYGRHEVYQLDTRSKYPTDPLPYQ